MPEEIKEPTPEIKEPITETPEVSEEVSEIKNIVDVQNEIAKSVFDQLADSFIKKEDMEKEIKKVINELNSVKVRVTSKEIKPPKEESITEIFNKLL